MDYRTYSVWNPALRADGSPMSPQPVAGDHLRPVVKVPSLLATALTTLVDRAWEWIQGVARWLVGGVEVVQRLLEYMGWLPAVPASVVTTTAGVAQPIHASASWAMKSAAEWSAFGVDSTSYAATVPSSPPPGSVVQSSSPEVSATESPGEVVPAKEEHENAPAVEESTPSLNLARAWLRATNPLQDADPSTDDVAWDEIPVGEVQRILCVAVSARARPSPGVNPDCERDCLGDWLGAVADIAFGDPVDRLHWLSEIAPTLVRHGIDNSRRGELIGAAADWLGEVPWRGPRAVFRALQVLEGIATSGIDPAGTLLERAGEVWRDHSWPRMRADDAENLLKVGVKRMTVALGRRDGPCARMYAQLILAIAPACYVDVAERLTWFARAVARPVGSAGLDGSPVRDVLTGGLGRWFEALARGSTCGAVDVVLEWWNSPMGACTDEASIAGWLSAARPGPSDRVLNE